MSNVKYTKIGSSGWSRLTLAASAGDRRDPQDDAASLLPAYGDAPSFSTVRAARESSTCFSQAEEFLADRAGAVGPPA